MTDDRWWERVRQRWASRGDVETIRRQLLRRGCDLERLDPAELAGFDQLHSGGRAATRAFADWVGVERGARVLDLGAGLGGSARELAHRLGCRVTALELSPELTECGAELTRWTGLGGRVTHLCAELGGWRTEERFDLIWLQHVDMHLPDKADAYRRCAAMVEPGGRVVWHDWLAGPGGGPSFPLPWSGEGDEITSLLSPAAFRDALEAAGLELVRLEPIPAETIAWFADSRRKIRRALDRPSTTGRERLARLLHEADGVIRNAEEERLIPFFGEARRSSAP